MNIVFQINGGIGKCILATAICKAIHDQYPDSHLIVVSGYPEVFISNPHVHRSFAFNQAQYFFEDFIENKEVKIMAHDPYVETGHVQQTEHVLDTWSNLFSLNLTDKTPQLFLTDREKNFFSHKFNTDKPILLLQTNGGAQGQELAYSWARDIPASITAQVIEEFRDVYTIVHMRREDQPGFEFTVPVQDNFRALCTLISMSRKRLLMDSFGHHAAAAMGMSSTVLWIANTPKVFGHDIHDNIVANPFTVKPELKNAYLGKFNIIGDPLEFPYNNETEIFNIDEVIKSIKKQ
jgi:hypothetical protein